MTASTVTSGPGASAEAIQAHYDISNEFFRLWLDPTLSYSAALWEDGDTLEEAQLRKIDFHLESAQARGAHNLLDVGCGWGSLLRRSLEHWGVHRAVGLCLSSHRQPHQGLHFGFGASCKC